MAAQTYVTIVLRKAVESPEAGQAVAEMVIEKMAEYPDVTISAGCSTKLEFEDK